MNLGVLGTLLVNGVYIFWVLLGHFGSHFGPMGFERESQVSFFHNIYTKDSKSEFGRGV